MKKIFQQHILPRWWLGAFVLFFIFIFQMGEENAKEVTQPNTNKSDITKTVVLTEEETVKGTVDWSEYKRIQTGDELKEVLNEMPKKEITDPKKEKAEAEKEKIEKDTKRLEHEKQLQRKRDVKNGVILSEEFTLIDLTKGITTYYVEQKQAVSEITPVLHKTSSMVYYEYPLKEKHTIQATALAEEQLIKNITVQLNDVSEALTTFEMMVGIVSPELTKEERDNLLKKMDEGQIHKFQTKKGIVYQWSISGESGILTIMKEKE